MKVLLTGSFGNIGSNTIKELLKQGHKVTCFDVRNKKTLKVWRRFADRVNVIWGDIRNREDIADAVKGQDAVLHLAAIIPPLSERESGLAEEVNIRGTRNLIEAMKELNHPPRLVFTSSYAVFGKKFDQPPPRSVADTLSPRIITLATR